MALRCDLSQFDQKYTPEFMPLKTSNGTYLYIFVYVFAVGNPRAFLWFIPLDKSRF